MNLSNAHCAIQKIQLQVQRKQHERGPFHPLFTAFTLEPLESQSKSESKQELFSLIGNLKEKALSVSLRIAIVSSQQKALLASTTAAAKRLDDFGSRIAKSNRVSGGKKRRTTTSNDDNGDDQVQCTEAIDREALRKAIEVVKEEGIGGTIRRFGGILFEILGVPRINEAVKYPEHQEPRSWSSLVEECSIEGIKWFVPIEAGSQSGSTRKRSSMSQDCPEEKSTENLNSIEKEHLISLMGLADNLVLAMSRLNLDDARMTVDIPLESEYQIQENENNQKPSIVNHLDGNFEESVLPISQASSDKPVSRLRRHVIIEDDDDDDEINNLEMCPNHIEANIMELPYSVIDPSINDFTEDAFSDFDEEVKQLNNDVQTIQVEGEFVDGRDETEELEFNNRSREHQMEMQSSSTSFTRQSHDIVHLFDGNGLFQDEALSRDIVDHVHKVEDQLIKVPIKKFRLGTSTNQLAHLTKPSIMKESVISDQIDVLIALPIHSYILHKSKKVHSINVPLGLESSFLGIFLNESSTFCKERLLYSVDFHNRAIQQRQCDLAIHRSLLPYSFAPVICSDQDGATEYSEKNLFEVGDYINEILLGEDDKRQHNIDPRNDQITELNEDVEIKTPQYTSQLDNVDDFDISALRNSPMPESKKRRYRLQAPDHCNVDENGFSKEHEGEIEFEIKAKTVCSVENSGTSDDVITIPRDYTKRHNQSTKRNKAIEMLIQKYLIPVSYREQFLSTFSPSHFPIRRLIEHLLSYLNLLMERSLKNNHVIRDSISLTNLSKLKVVEQYDGIQGNILDFTERQLTPQRLFFALVFAAHQHNTMLISSNRSNQSTLLNQNYFIQLKSVQLHRRNQLCSSMNVTETV